MDLEARLEREARVLLGSLGEPATRLRARHGSQAVFLVDCRLVLKLFARGAKQQYRAEVEGLARCAQSPFLKMHAPRLLRHGRHGKGHFVLSSQMPGRGLLQTGELAIPDMVQLAVFCGRALRELHAVRKPNDELCLVKWGKTLRRQQARVHQLGHLRKRLLPTVLDELRPESDFWPANPLVLMGIDSPCFLHGDLNNENVLVDYIKGNPPHFSLIDLGDSFVGHRVYDFIPVYLSVLCCDKGLFITFLHAYGLEHLPANPKELARILMVYCLLSASPAMKTAVRYVPAIRECQSIAEIQTLLFDVTVNP